MKVYRVVLKVLDFEDNSKKDVISLLEQNRYIHPSVLKIEAKSIMDDNWDDDNPMNRQQTLEQFNEAFERL